MDDPVFPLTDLPFDILDLIAGSISSHRDLVSLAAVSSACKELVLPRHTEYRTLRLGSAHPEVWAHLAQRPDLARNIREVTIREGAPGWKTSKKPERYPVTLVGESTVNAATIVISNICQALRSMDSLQRFTWVEAWSPSGSYHDMAQYYHGVFQALKESKSLVQLKIVDKVVQDGLAGPAKVDEYPLWHIADLQTLSLKLLGWWPQGLKSLLMRSPNLQSLDIRLPVESPVFTTCRLPQLRRLDLTSTGSIGEQVIADFLQHHPTIEDLRWYPHNETLQLSYGSLPILKRLITNPGFACSILSDPTVPSRAIECVSQLSLDDKTLAILDAIDTSQLRDLRFWRYPGLDSINHLAQLFPQLTHLEIPKFGIPTRTDVDSNYTVDDYILALSRFRSLEYLLDSSIWPALQLAGPDKIASLATRCPKLQRLGHFSPQKSLYVDIVLDRDGEAVSWREEISRSPE
ncbi:hypothetical protein C8R44DRAFT_706889 [Mycena epipterygia]|nr:hypothetical protein C8R44DRAFT_706889 [Mycena epipterygia]